MEDGISMATKRQVTLRFRDEYVRASKKQKGVILDRMCETLGVGRSTARRLPAQAGQHGNGVVPSARERPCRYSGQSRQLLVRVWVLMDMPCGKYLKVMLPQWLPVLRDCGELDEWDGHALGELMAMSASTIDRYLRPVRDAARPRGLAATRPAGELSRNSITIRKASDELDGLPGNVEADTVAHCGPSLKGEFRRTPAVVDFATGWTENASARDNAYRNLSQAEAMIEQRLPFTIRSYDNDNGSESVNTDFITHLQQLDIQQTRSRPYRKNDQATVESRDNHVVRKHAFHYRYELAELDLLNELWRLVSVKADLFTPSKKPVGRSGTRDGRPQARLRPAHDPMAAAQTIRPTGPGQRRGRIHPARPARTHRTPDRHHEPGRARPPHPRHPGPARDHGRTPHTPPREETRPRHAILEQDTRQDRGRPTGRPQRNTSRHRLGFRAHPT